MSTTTDTNALVREIHEAFQRSEFDRWDGVIAEDVASHPARAHRQRCRPPRGLKREPSERLPDLVLGLQGVQWDAGGRWVSLTLEVGLVTAWLGANGSGKSTLIRALAGFHSLAAGTIEVRRCRCAAGSPGPPAP
jgi:ABC-type multidrug transport system fused ATPase/permease subunit